MITTLTKLHHSVFSKIEELGDKWLLGLLARLVFLAVLPLFFWNSAKTKIGTGIFGFLNISDGAYFQILGEPTMTEYGFDTANVPWYLDIVVAAGTYAEFILPLLIIIGLFTRLSSLAMIGFVTVLTIVDITVHKIDATSIGALFDRDPSSLVLDQRLLWIFILITLAVKGAGAISADHLLKNWWQTRSN